MYGGRIVVPILILASQTSASTVKATYLTTAGPSLSAIQQDFQPGEKEHYKRDDDENLIGYFIKDSKTRTYRCPNADLWLGDTIVSGRRSTYAHCSGQSAIPGDTPPIGTTCLDNTVFWANMDATEIANRGSRYCGKYSCITVTVYDSYDDGFGSGPQYWIDCAENLRPPEDISEFYRTMPEVTAKTSLESTSSTTELSATITTEASLPSSITSEIASETASRDSGESSSQTTVSESSTTATEKPKPMGGNSLSGGAIAGIVIGSFLGGILFTSIIILRRSRSSVASQSQGGMDEMKLGTVGGSQMELVDRRG